MVDSNQNIQRKSGQTIRKLSMALLATLPLLGWYEIPFPLSLGYALVLFWSTFCIVKFRMRINVMPRTFWFVVAYVCILWCYANDFALWTFLPPGGWLFFLFIICVIWGCLTFEIVYIRKYMRWIVLFSIVLFWIQYILLILTGSQMICFVPRLTESFTYEGLSYAELVSVHLASKHPCSIFLEKSYMAYYLLTYLSITLFNANSKKKILGLFTKETAIICITLVFLKSGTAIVGLGVLLLALIFKEYWTKGTKRRISLIILLLPVCVGTLFLYLNSDAGQEMLSRQEEFSKKDSSGYDRVVEGYLIYSMMPDSEKLFGNPKAREEYSETDSKGKQRFYINGIQSILIYTGLCGTILYLIFYSSLYRHVDFTSKMSLIVLLIMSLLESNYLNAYMMLLTIIPCAAYYKNKKTVE